MEGYSPYVCAKYFFDSTGNDITTNINYIINSSINYIIIKAEIIL